MTLDEEEKGMLAGELGEPKRWVIDHQLKVGQMFDAQDIVTVSQSHMMVDPESVGNPGVRFFGESLPGKVHA